MKWWTKTLLAGAALGAALGPKSLWACAACYGQSNDALARGMNWGILSLLGVVSVVLASVASFFVYLGKRSAAVSAAPTPAADGAASESSGTRTADPQPPTPAH